MLSKISLIVLNVICLYSVSLTCMPYSSEITGCAKPLSQWEVTSDDLELPRCKSTVKAICIGSVDSANYPDQWSDATFIRCKCHWSDANVTVKARSFFSFAVRWRCVSCNLARFPKRPSPSFLSESLLLFEVVILPWVLFGGLGLGSVRVS